MKPLRPPTVAEYARMSWHARQRLIGADPGTERPCPMCGVLRAPVDLIAARREVLATDYRPLKPPTGGTAA